MHVLHVARPKSEELSEGVFLDADGPKVKSGINNLMLAKNICNYNWRLLGNQRSIVSAFETVIFQNCGGNNSIITIKIKKNY